MSIILDWWFSMGEDFITQGAFNIYSSDILSTWDPKGTYNISNKASWIVIMAQYV